MEDEPTAVVRFKRRKIGHPRKTYVPDGNTSSDAPLDSPDSEAPTSQTPTIQDESSGSNLKEILRQRKRPQDRMREAARRAAEKKAETLVQTDMVKSDVYGGRFVAQTGQVVDKDDEQMALYVEARLAEQNFRKYGWPIPKHLESVVAAITPTAEHELPVSSSANKTTDQVESDAKNSRPGHGNRLAAGMGKLQEIDLGPEASAKNIQRTEEARRRLEGLPLDVTEETNGNNEQASKPEKRRRWQKRRNSEDVKRDMMVEAVLREAKLDYFEEDRPPTPPGNDEEDADDAFYEQFRRDYESSEARNQQQRKPAPPPGPKGIKEQPKGPKLGGSRSARAAMRLQEEQAAKNKR